MARGKKEKLSLEELLEQALLKVEDQPYQVPSNWVWTKIGKITDIISGGTPSSKVSEYYEKGEIPWISPADLSGYTDMYISHGRKNITELGLQKSSAKLMPKDTVLLSSRAPIGYVAIARNALCTNQGFKSFLPSKAYIPQYLYFYLKSIKHILESYASGTTFLELSGSKAALVEVPLPPLAEQQRIVERIESLFEKLDTAKELIQNALDSFENRKAAILHKAFTGELTAKWREENDMSLDSWEESTFGKFVDTKYGYTESASTEEVGPKFLRITDIQDGSVNWNSVPYCTISDIEFEKYKLKVDDIVVARTGATTGKSYIILEDVNAVFASYLIRINIINKNRILPKYLWRFMQSTLYWNQIMEVKKGIAQPGVNANKLKELLIYIPSIEEQNEILRIVEGMLDKEYRVQELCDVIEKIDLMKKSILARAFRGELETNHPEEESAENLLREILEKR